jgi:hypothetical protein
MAVRKPLVRVSGRVTQLPAADSIVATDPTRVLLTSVGVANGVASLDGTGKVPSAQLPSYVDDVLEVASFSALPATGESGKIYVTLDTNYEYRWGGSAYVRLVASPGSSDAVPEGATNLYFTAARVLATVLSGLSVAAGGDVIATDNVLVAFGKIQNRLSQLGTAANATLTTSTTDSTAGRVLRVGDFGIGSAAGLPATLNIDNSLLAPGLYTVNSGAAGFVGTAPEQYGILRVSSKVSDAAGTWAYQEFFGTSSNYLYKRQNVNASGWTTWRRMLTGEDLTVGVQDTTAGRVLKVGDFGVNGGDAVLLDAAVNWDTIFTPSEYYIPGASGTNNPSAAANLFLKVTRSSGNIWKQYAYQLGAARYWSRAYNNGAWTAWDKNVGRGDIVGTVGWANSQPSGAIVEYGTNANGQYVRYADGTQICWKRVGLDGSSLSAGTSLFGTNAYGGGSYPAAFNGIPTVTAAAQYYGNAAIAYIASCYTQPTQASWGNWRALSVDSLSLGGSINLVAIGRWYN